MSEELYSFVTHIKKNASSSFSDESETNDVDRPRCGPTASQSFTHSLNDARRDRDRAIRRGKRETDREKIRFDRTRRAMAAATGEAVSVVRALDVVDARIRETRASRWLPRRFFFLRICAGDATKDAGNGAVDEKR